MLNEDDEYYLGLLASVAVCWARRVPGDRSYCGCPEVIETFTEKLEEGAFSAALWTAELPRQEIAITVKDWLASWVTPACDCYVALRDLGVLE